MCAKSHAIGPLKTVTPRERRVRRPSVEGKTGTALTSIETAMELDASPIRDRQSPLSGGQVLRSQIGMIRCLGAAVSVSHTQKDFVACHGGAKNAK